MEEKYFIKQIDEICKPFEQSKLYDMIRERVERLVNGSSDKDEMIAYLYDSAMEYYKEDPIKMLSSLNLVIKSFNGQIPYR